MRHNAKWTGLIVASALLAAANSIVFAHNWKDSSGKYSIEADFVSLDSGVVTLKKPDGTTVAIPLAKLSSGDQDEAKQAAAGNPFVATTSKAIDPSSKNRSTEGSSTKSDDMTTVIADGTGGSENDALKDAFRNAVREVVGAVVDAETLVKNDDVISDKVLTYSDGFIKSYDEIPGSKKSQGDLHSIKIKARIERRSVVAKLKASNVAVKDVEGKSLFAEAVTQMEAEKDASALLTKALEGFPENVIECSVIGKPELIEKSDNSATVRIKIKIAANEKAYAAFSKRLSEVLEKVARDKAAWFGRFQKGTSFGQDFSYLSAGSAAGFATSMPKGLDIEHSVLKVEYGIRVKLQPKSTTVGLALHWNGAANTLDGKYYVFDDSVANVLVKCSQRRGAGKVTLLASDSSTIATEPFSLQKVPGVGYAGYVFQGSPVMPLAAENNTGEFRVLDTNDKELRLAEPEIMFVIWPLFSKLNSGSVDVLPEMVGAKDIKVPLADLQRITNVKCEVSFE